MGNTVTKAKLIVEGQGKPIQVEFNPTEYNLSSSIQYSEKMFRDWMVPLASILQETVPP